MQKHPVTYAYLDLKQIPTGKNDYIKLHISTVHKMAPGGTNRMIVNAFDSKSTNLSLNKQCKIKQLIGEYPLVNQRMIYDMWEKL